MIEKYKKTCFIIFLSMLMMLMTANPVAAQQSDETFVQIPVNQIFETKIASVKNEFAYQLEGKRQNEPLPIGGHDGVYLWKMKKNTSRNLDIRIRETGIYDYEIYEINAKKKHYVYDTKHYQLKIRVFYNRKDQLIADSIIRNEQGEKVSEITFENAYTGKGESFSKKKKESGFSKAINVKTGDFTPWISYFGLLIGSILCLWMIMFIKQKCEKGDERSDA